MINREFKAKETKYTVLLNFGKCCRELGGAQICKFLRLRAQFLLCHRVLLYRVSQKKKDYAFGRLWNNK